jgi:hypothetical protein
MPSTDPEGIDPRIITRLRERASGSPSKDLYSRIVGRATETAQRTPPAPWALSRRPSAGLVAAGVAGVVVLLSAALLTRPPAGQRAAPGSSSVGGLTTATATATTTLGADRPTRDPARPAPPSSCPVTVPSPPFVPPSPFPRRYPHLEGDSQYAWYGTPSLWTALDTRGEVWWALPRTDLGLTNKTFWYSAAYSVLREPVPDIVVRAVKLDTGEMLEGEWPTNAVDGSGESMLVGVDVPSTGCWVFTGAYRGAKLTFTVWVAD